jgi:hypothetical protein
LSLAVRILAAANGIIDNRKIRSPARDRSADASRIILSTCPLDLPLARSLPVRGDPYPKHVAVSLGAEKIADTPAKTVGKVLGVARRDDGMVGVAPEVPCRKDLACVEALPRPRRKAEH